MSSLGKSSAIIRKFKPNVVIGTGGFASGPLLQMANSAGIPTVIQEQNSYPGITNKLLSKKANAICVAYENLERFFPKDKMILTGNPVRQDLINIKDKKEEAISYFKLNPNKKTILILGGSLGSRRINQLIAKEIPYFEKQDVQLIWQCGKFYIDEYKHFSENKNVQVLSFIDRMDLVYAAADIVISRSGASSVSELCIVGKPVVFIPSPNVAEDHQTKNAKAIVDKRAALLIKESELDAEFETVFDKLLADEYQQKVLSDNIHKLAKANATKDIVDAIVKLIK
jgi:UDP-N-acetylglucosamine--N-acetylmuramyl-(pentapeptide) pyrophosphoryl-undecaprenol N-acetylglucosamine transferase